MSQAPAKLSNRISPPPRGSIRVARLTCKTIRYQPLPGADTWTFTDTSERTVALVQARAWCAQRGFTDDGDYGLVEYTPGGRKRSVHEIDPDREVAAQTAEADLVCAASEGSVAGSVAQLSEVPRHLSPTFSTGDVVLTPGANIGLIVGVNAHERRASVRTRYGIESMPTGSLRVPDLVPAAAWWEQLTERERKAYLSVSLQVTGNAAWAWSRMVDDAPAQVAAYLRRQGASTRHESDLILRYARPSNTFVEFSSTEEMLKVQTGICSTVRHWLPGETLSIHIEKIRLCWIAPRTESGRCALHWGQSGWVWIYHTEADELLERLAAYGLQDRRQAVCS